MEIFYVNGIPVVYYYLPSRMTNIQFVTRIGSMLEKDNEWGICHYLEHMLFKGSPKYPQYNSITFAAQQIGAELNAWTSADGTNFHITCLNEYFDKSFDILFDMYSEAFIPSDETDKERNPILSEYRMSMDDPGSFLDEKFKIKIYGDKVHPVLGTEKSILAITPEQLRAFKKTYYNRENMIVAVSGGISKEKIVEKLSLFDNFNSGIETSYPEITYTPQTIEITKKSLMDSIYSLVIPIAPNTTELSYHERSTYGILTKILSQLLFDRIREELGMSCYAIYAMRSFSKIDSSLGVMASIDPKQVKELHGHVCYLIKNLPEKITDEVMARGMASSKMKLAYSLESPQHLNSILASSVIFGHVYDPIEKFTQELETLTKEDVLEKAKFVSELKDISVGYLLPEEEKNE